MEAPGPGQAAGALALRSGLNATPAPRSSSGRTAATTSANGCYFNTTPDVRVPAFVLVPKKADRPLPAVVALHDHGGFYLWGKEKLVETDDEHPVLTAFKKRYYAGTSIATDLVRQGYVVVVIDMFYWGERRMLLDDDPDDWRKRPKELTAERIAAFNQRSSQSEQLVGRTIYAAGFTWPGVMFWDDIRTVDYLLTRPEVDPKRIGCVGLSVGGLRSCHLAALDDRIKAAVVVGWMTSFPAQLERHVRNTIGHTKIVPGLYRHLDYPDVASLAMPAALLVINGSKDGLFHPDGVKACFRQAGGLLQEGGHPRAAAHPAVRRAARVQRRDAGRGVGVAEEVGLSRRPAGTMGQSAAERRYESFDNRALRMRPIPARSSSPPPVTLPRRAHRDRIALGGPVPRPGRRDARGPRHLRPGQVGHHAVPARRSRAAGDVGPQAGWPFARAGRVRGDRHQRDGRPDRRTAAAVRADHAPGGAHPVAQPRQRQPRAGEPCGDDRPRAPTQRGEPRRLSARADRLSADRRRAERIAQARPVADVGTGRSPDAARATAPSCTANFPGSWGLGTVRWSSTRTSRQQTCASRRSPPNPSYRSRD